jgi:hypothetical protein
MKDREYNIAGKFGIAYIGIAYSDRPRLYP